MSAALKFDPAVLPPSAEALREPVRAFVDEVLPADFRRNSDFGSSHDAKFSRAMAARGWIGMTWPAEYGGGDRSFFERYVITEELLAAGAPVGAHWIADRQSGPLLLRYGTAAQKQRYLPPVTRGEMFFSIGMSEPGTGSDLASVRTAAKPVDGGWLVNGTKLWTTGAHKNHQIIALVRTSGSADSRHQGLSQLIIDLAGAGVSVRPIRNLKGSLDFNEVVFTDCFVPADCLIGEEGNGWEQVTSELGYERSGPERFLSAFRVFVEFVRAVGPTPAPHQRALIGSLTASFMTLRRMSISVAAMLQEGASPMVEAALIKELGNGFERRVPELIRVAASGIDDRCLRETLADTVLLSPSFSLRGGTREILRGVIARGLGLR